MQKVISGRALRLWETKWPGLRQDVTPEAETPADSIPEKKARPDTSDLQSVFLSLLHLDRHTDM